LRKSSRGKNSNAINFLNYDNTNRFLRDGVENYRKLISENKISISPFSSLPNGVSRFFIDHADYFSNQDNEINSGETIFHSDYYWLGSSKRNVAINFNVDEVLPDEANIIQIRIHSYSTYESDNVGCVYEKEILVANNMTVNEVIELNTDENFNYAFLCNLISGNISCSSISIESFSVIEKPSNSLVKIESEGVDVL
jgi:hypothetical protein